ncbi:hypothetical protein [Pseudoalteromonas luteoviolacea]|uniref:DUF4062 domain-containing protein n=1 Tax=Pseudoalteromonas luteoviolacea S4054 TaxID=1129367 RepID=A0A0F6AD89_9GAMM|nr:hypothetical protein [Pseudoalteromonas luteoviolacea]AOT06703.1 hypothetical protein S4054249_01865 [Pseudoalteromonas luteoviolacea]AOT11621.1 hypothetical protein S40542_01865 [Pseudoalteromonas luteoviolacea]AOT16533.1 hypothetical protein S4054_01865 [Pseudoalteromonas luteoviolacea]KKE83791.1 hypothetical protein N479_12425 [Pseudoalteromonas luteoviolacea S4054]KZN73926.1 hypothetical protein N481_10830 [Pseudoalteromonas luteoviolacea S4047-1]
MKLSTVIEVLIASPSDVLEERNTVEEVLHSWNSTSAAKEGIFLKPVRWEKDSYSQIGDRPQELLNKQIVENADIVIGIFWTRLGTPTGGFSSGTVEEIQQFIGKGKPVAIYFSEKHYNPYDLDTNEFSRLKDFKSQIQSKGLYKHFRSLEQLKQIISFDISKIVSEIQKTSNVIGSFYSGFPRVELNNLMKHKASWQKCFDRHQGSYIVYNFLQPNPAEPLDSDNDVKVAAALLSFKELTSNGIAFEWINPYKLEHEQDWRAFIYKGVALPAGEAFINLYADQVNSDYECLSATVQYSPIYPPSIITGQMIAVGVNTDRNVFRVGGAGIALARVSDMPPDISEWYGRKLGFLSREQIPDNIWNNIPKVYSR